jgi:hypothetical protein
VTDGIEEPRRHPAAFPLDDRRVYDAYVAGRQGAALAAGVRVGLFDRLDRASASAQDLAEDLGLSLRPVTQLLRTLFAMGFVTRTEETWALAPDAAAYLVRDRPGSLWGLIDMEVDHFLSPAALVESLRSDDASIYGGEDPWDAHEADADKARAFTAAMHSVSERPAAGLAEVAPLASSRRLLDVGGGSGALSIALARAFPDLHCTVGDLPVVCDLAREYAERADLSGRIDAQPVDMFQGLPTGHDAVLLSQILHDWSPTTGQQLLAHAFAALPAGGRILIHEKLVDAQERGPLANVLVHLDMLVWTQGQQFTLRDLHDMLAGAGFVSIEGVRTAGYWTLVHALKP